MNHPVSAFVRIAHEWTRTAAIGLFALGLLAGGSSRAQTGDKTADPHAHHGAAAPTSTAEPPAVSAVPSRSTTVATPSWFRGGQGLYVPYYFDTFKDIDLSPLGASQKERFLHRVNTEFCSCNQTGCRRDPIARCYLTDLTCPRAPIRIREMLEKVKTEGTGAESAPPAPSATITPGP